SLEQTTKECGILIANLPADLVGGSIGALEAAFRVFDAQALNILDWRKSCGLTEAPLERAFGKSRSAHHFLYRIGDGEMGREPLLRGRYGGIAMIHPALEDDVGRKPLVVPLKREVPRDRLRGGGADVPCYEIEHEVMPCHRGA